jgi:hypothetical protein
MMWAVMLLSAGSAYGAKRESREVSWDEMRKEVASRGLLKRNAKVHLADQLPTDVYKWAGGRTEVKTKITQINENGLHAKQLVIPRTAITSLEFRFKQGKRRLFGTLIGFGAGVALVAASLYWGDAESESGYGAVGVPVIGGGIGLGIGAWGDQRVVKFSLLEGKPAESSAMVVPRAVGMGGTPSYPREKSRAPSMQLDIPVRSGSRVRVMLRE